MSIELNLLYNDFWIKLLFLEMKLAKRKKVKINKFCCDNVERKKYINLRLFDVLKMCDSYIFNFLMWERKKWNLLTLKPQNYLIIVINEQVINLNGCEIKWSLFE